MLGNPNWCSKECDVTAKFENIKFPKNIEKISLNNSSQQEKISYFKKIQNKFKKFKKILPLLWVK